MDGDQKDGRSVLMECRLDHKPPLKRGGFGHSQQPRKSRILFVISESRRDITHVQRFM